MSLRAFSAPSDQERSRDGARDYDHIVELQSGSSPAPPIFFVHSGSGHTEPFNSLSDFFSDRRVYALRAPGFNTGEEMFTSLEDMIEEYTKAIQARQSVGPYVLIGNSFGGTIAFEISKRIESLGEKVGFLGILDHPPNIQYRMARLSWLQLGFGLMRGLKLISPEEAQTVDPSIFKLPNEEGLGALMSIASAERLLQADLEKGKMKQWVDLSWELIALARHYEPSGSVESMDVFCAMPIGGDGALSKQKWLEEHLLAWNDFVRTAVQFHDVAGSHETIIDPENVSSFQKWLKGAMRSRGML